MSDQPKPTSEKLDSALRSLRDYHDEPRPYEGNPKPTGKQESAIPGFNVDGSKREPTGEWECPDCHTRKPMTGEWTVEQMGDHAFDLKCGDKILWTFATEPPAQSIADAHSHALAAERRAAEVKWNEAVAVRDINHLNRIQELEKQLAAERKEKERWQDEYARKVTEHENTKGICDILNEQLATEHTNAEAWRLLAEGKEGAYLKMMQVSEVAANEWARENKEQQLAAEQKMKWEQAEKVQVLVNALKESNQMLVACSESSQILKRVDRSGGWQKAEKGILDLIQRNTDALEKVKS